MKKPISRKNALSAIVYGSCIMVMVVMITWRWLLQ